MNFSIEESKENGLIIKAVTGNIKTRTIQNLLFSQTLQAVRINHQGAPGAFRLGYIILYITLCLSLQTFAQVLFPVSLGTIVESQEKIKTMLMQKF